jgi:LmbE family N-acetylglucosaminyl deacetylase
MNGKINKVLVVAPHPDDEVLGCGGTIKKLAAMNLTVWVLIVSRGKKGIYTDKQIENIRNEAINAHKILGVKQTKFLEFPAPELDLVSISTLSSAIAKIVEDFRPDTLFLPHGGDIHHDHKAVFNAGLVASRPVNNCPVRRIYSYETLSETEWSSPFCGNYFIPTCYVNITDVFEFKLEALQCYKSQLRDFPNPRSLKSVTSLADLRGSTVGFSKAEAFIVIRITED